MIQDQRNSGMFTIFCDQKGCATEQTFDTNKNFQGFIAEARVKGWVMRKSGEGWEHTCPKCVMEVA